MEYYRGSNEPKMQLAEWHFDGMCDLGILNTLKYKSTLKKFRRDHSLCHFSSFFICVFTEHLLYEYYNPYNMWSK